MGHVMNGYATILGDVRWWLIAAWGSWGACYTYDVNELLGYGMRGML